MVCSRPLQNKNITYTALNIHWNNIIGLLNLLKLGVDESFIQVKY